jgi:hypothetical protein
MEAMTVNCVAVSASCACVLDDLHVVMVTS